ncbi:MAG: hypothetical protein ACKV19_03440 [Verrucomicrobiales bacterium]
MGVGDFQLKTIARFGALPEKIQAGEFLTIQATPRPASPALPKCRTGCAASGIRCLGTTLISQPHPGKDAQIVPFDPNAIKGFDAAKLHAVPFDLKTIQPREWPLRYTVCRWTAAPGRLAAGNYELRCRTIDRAGQAQPMPRPFPKSGRNRNSNFGSGGRGIVFRECVRSFTFLSPVWL